MANRIQRSHHRMTVIGQPRRMASKTHALLYAGGEGLAPNNVQRR